jgi:hypothetical protein
MSGHHDAWDDGRSAWERLAHWQRGESSALAPLGAGEAALRALEDIGSLRRLLDQTELAAVRAARSDGKSWAEIATMLGVTRQSAWERWRDLDEGQRWRDLDEESVPVEAIDVPDVPDVAAQVSKLGGNAVGKLRRRSWVKVPNLIGMRVQDARAALHKQGLMAANGDPDGAPLDPDGPAVDAALWQDSVVTQQTPEWGARVPPGFAVRLWISRRGGGSAGVREPRRPSPSPLTAREMRSDPAERLAEESVG